MLPGLDGRFELGRAELIGDGDGRRARRARQRSRVEAVARRRAARASRASTPRVAVVSSLQPAPDRRPRRRCSRACRSRVTVEAHYVDRRARLARRRGRRRARPRLPRSSAAACATMPTRPVGQPRATCSEQHGLSAAALADGRPRTAPAGADASDRGRPPDLDRPAGPQPGATTSSEVVGELPGRARPPATSRYELVLRPERLPRRLGRDLRARLADGDPSVRWRRARSRAAGGARSAPGSREARGDLLCYTNSARTTPRDADADARRTPPRTRRSC